MRIVHFKAANVKRIRVVEITPQGHVVELRGRNAQGKSSVMDAICMVLGGARLCPAEPVRRGAEAGQAVVEFDEDLVATRTWTDGGEKSTLSVTTRQGAPLRSPQAVLDKICGRLTFDPLAFMDYEEKDQKRSLMKLTGLQDRLDELQKRHDELYANRREWNAEVDRLKGAIASKGTFPPDLPENPLNPAAIAKELEEALAKNADNARARQAHQARVNTELPAATRALEQANARIVELERQLSAARVVVIEAQKALRELQARVDEDAAALRDLEDVDAEPIRQRMNKVNDTNALIRARVDVRGWQRELKDAVAESKQFTDALDRLEKERTDLLTHAKFPVAGLGFNENGVTYNGIPFSQASDAQKILVSTAIAMAENPTLRVMMTRKGSMLDAENFALLCQVAASNDYQLWVERHGKPTADEAPGAIVIEDGMVVGAETPAE